MAFQNIFQGAAAALDEFNKQALSDLQEDRKQTESLAATNLVNNFESTLAQSLLEEQTRFDGSYDLDRANKDRFILAKEDALGKITNKNVRVMVEKGLTNYEATYGIQSKAMSLQGEKEIQLKLMNDNRSFSIAKIAQDPDSYWSELNKLNEAAKSWRPDIQREQLIKEQSALGSRYVMSQLDSYSDSYYNGTFTKKDWDAKVAELEIGFVKDDKVSLDAATRETLLDHINATRTGLMSKIKTSRDAVLQDDFDNKMSAFEKGQNIGDPDAFLEVMRLQISNIYEDDPVKAKAAEDRLKAAALVRAHALTVKNGDTMQMQKVAAVTAQQKQFAFASGDQSRGNALQAAEDKMRSTAATAAAEIIKSPSDWFIKNDPEIEAAFFNGYSRQKYAELTMRKQIPVVGVENIELAFPAYKQAVYADFATVTTDYSQFVGLVDNLKTAWGTKINPTLGISPFDKIVKEFALDKEAPALVRAIPYAGTNEGKEIFQVLASKEKPNVEIKSEKIKSALASNMKDFNAGLAVYTGLSSTKNPAENYRQLITALVTNSKGLPEYANKSEEELTKYWLDRTLKKDYKVISTDFTSAGNNKISLPAAYAIPEIEGFLKSKIAYQKFVRGELAGKQDKQGYLMGFSIEGREDKLKYAEVLRSGRFLPVGDGSVLRMYVDFVGSKKPSALIKGRNAEGKPQYIDIRANNVVNIYGPKYNPNFFDTLSQPPALFQEIDKLNNFRDEVFNAGRKSLSGGN